MSILLGPATPGWALEPTPGYSTIQQAFLREEFATAAALARAFLADHPDVPEVPRVSLWLALSLDRLQRPTEGLRALDELKGRLNPDDPVWPEALFWEGDICRRAFQMTRAKSAYRRLLARSPDSMWAAQAQLGLGLIAVYEQAFEPAIGYFHTLALDQPGTPVGLDAAFFEGFCHLRLLHYGEATTQFEALASQVRDPTMNAQVAFYLAESYAGQRRYEEAARAYGRALNASTSSKWTQLAQLGLGFAYYRAGQCRESVDALERYIAQAVGDHRTEALFAQGNCLARLGQEDQALSRFEQIVSRDPGHPLALDAGLLIVDVYRRQERLALAKELLHTLLRWPLTDASRAKVQLRLGRIALDQNNPAQANTVFDLARHAEDPAIRQMALTGLGDVEALLGNLEEAARWYDQAMRVLEHTAQASIARYQLGRVQLQLGNVDQAINLFLGLTTDAKGALVDDARLALALAYLNHGERDLARAQLDAMRRQHPHSLLEARAAYYLALLALSEGDEGAAQRLCQDTLQGAPTSEEAVDARLLLADLKARQISVDAAIEWLKTAYDSTAFAPRHRAQFAKRLGDLSRADRRYAEAVRWYEDAIDLAPSLSGEANYRIATCYEEAGDLEMATQRYQAVEPSPWRVRAQLGLAKLLEREDRLEEAQAIYERLADEPIPEAKVVQERLMVLRKETTARVP